MSIQTHRGVVLTRKGLIAAIVLAAEPFHIPACHCGAHAGRDGLCKRHRDNP